MPPPAATAVAGPSGAGSGEYILAELARTLQVSQDLSGDSNETQSVYMYRSGEKE